MTHVVQPQCWVMIMYSDNWGLNSQALNYLLFFALLEVWFKSNQLNKNAYLDVYNVSLISH